MHVGKLNAESRNVLSFYLYGNNNLYIWHVKTKIIVAISMEICLIMIFVKILPVTVPTSPRMLSISFYIALDKTCNGMFYFIAFRPLILNLLFYGGDDLITNINIVIFKQYHV